MLNLPTIGPEAFWSKAFGYSVLDGCDVHNGEMNGSVYSDISSGFWPAVDFCFYGLASRWDKVSQRLRGCAQSIS